MRRTIPIIAGVLAVLFGMGATDMVVTDTEKSGHPPFDPGGYVVLDSADTYTGVISLENCNGTIVTVIEAWGDSLDITHDDYADSLHYKILAKWFKEETTWNQVDSLLLWDTADSSVLVRGWQGIGTTGQNRFPGRWLKFLVQQASLQSFVTNDSVPYDTAHVRVTVRCDK